MTKTNARSWKAWLYAALSMALSASAYAADPDSGNFTVRITPNVDVGLTVDTSGANWAGPSADLDVSMDLGSTLLLESAVTVSITGDFNNQEIEVLGAANDTWTLGASAADATDKLRLYALFGKTSGGASFAEADFFDDTHLITTGAKLAGQPQPDEQNDSNHTYEGLLANAQYEDLDTLAVGTSRLLWLRADTPGTTTVDQQQSFTVTLTAKSGTGQ